ncbi:MAG TPA: two-component regulator propeller domain-containing protein [Pyrinomonadaceae bacterium]|nr:two-component regulator propeller domain-containing protein [Pyrinomonadaceae bacterium]
MACLVGTASAVDPHRALSQYARDRWGTKDGFPGGPVYAITQTPDGYLWSGTEKGLVRFDGLKFQLIEHAAAPTLPASPVSGLTVDAEGNLWVRLVNMNLLQYKHGLFENVSLDDHLGEPRITAMCRGIHGELLFSELKSGIFKDSGGEVEKLVSMSKMPNFLVISMAQTSDSNIWLGTRDAGLFRLNGGQTTPITDGLPDRKINCLLPGNDGTLWIGTDNGVVRWDGSGVVRDGVPPTLNHTQVFSMIRDRDGNVWVGTAGGLVRIDAGGGTLTETSASQFGSAVTALFEDREGNIWVGDGRGIERLRDSVFVTYSRSDNLPSETNGPLHIGAEGRTWFAPSTGGLSWLEKNQIGRVKNQELDRDVIYSVAGDSDDLWIGRQRGGLTHLRSAASSFNSETYTQAQGLAQNSVYAVYQSRDGSVWAGTLSGGVSRLKDGKFTTYTTANGLASNTITSILEGSDGTMWFATSGGLNSLSNDRWQKYLLPDGSPLEYINCLAEGSNGVLWIGTDRGLAYLDSGRVVFSQKVPGQLNERVMGLAEDQHEWLWVATENHVLRVRANELLRGELGDADLVMFGPEDGLLSTEGVKRHQTVVADRSGRIWFSLARGLSVVDPNRLTNSSTETIVHIRNMSADGTPLDWRSGSLLISAARQRLTIGFEGVSLSVPERVKFRYLLEGFDHGWSEPSATREAIYTNLEPGLYRFRVMASNGDGVWSGPEAVIGFEVEPVWWQTWWFRFSLAIVCGLTLLALYRLRLYQLTRQLNVRFEERLAERTRIAQELHDTLLQGYLSASMQLHVAADQLPPDSPAKPLVNRVLELMGQVNRDGRTALTGLRSARTESFNLAQSFSEFPQEMAHRAQINYRVALEGRFRPLHPLIGDEVYRIGREALTNAFHHSGAQHIAVEIEYADNSLRLLVRDDGQGIDPVVLREGREGHWGLSGMRERAQRIGGRLQIRGRAGSGTEVELSVPGPVAFQTEPSDRLSQRLVNFFQPKKRSPASEKETTD